MSLVIAPSILSADFARLAEAASAVEGAADWLHVDVMDNHFVPNLTLGPPVVKSLAAATDIPLDCHLMITDVDRWAGDFVDAGATSVTFHAEATTRPADLARELRERGARAGLALKPGTPIEAYEDVLGEFDMILVMTVEPGFGGQAFIAEMLPKIATARRLLDARGGGIWLQVDGGVAPGTIELCAEAGATAFVAGSAVYGADDPAEAITRLRAAASAAAETAALARSTVASEG